MRFWSTPQLLRAPAPPLRPRKKSRHPPPHLQIPNTHPPPRANPPCFAERQEVPLGIQQGPGPYSSRAARRTAGMSGCRGPLGPVPSGDAVGERAWDHQPRGRCRLLVKPWGGQIRTPPSPHHPGSGVSPPPAFPTLGRIQRGRVPPTHLPTQAPPPFPAGRVGEVAAIFGRGGGGRGAREIGGDGVRVGGGGLKNVPRCHGIRCHGDERRPQSRLCLGHRHPISILGKYFFARERLKMFPAVEAIFSRSEKGIISQKREILNFPSREHAPRLSDPEGRTRSRGIGASSRRPLRIASISSSISARSRSASRAHGPRCPPPPPDPHTHTSDGRTKIQSG